MSPYDLEVLESSDPNVVRVALSGELDLTNARELERRLEELTPTDSLLVLDVNRVVFVDSAALHVLFTLARRRGGDRLCVVLGPESPIVRTLEIVGLAEAARVGASEDELLSPAPS